MEQNENNHSSNHGYVYIPLGRLAEGFWAGTPGRRLTHERNFFAKKYQSLILGLNNRIFY